MNVKGQLETQGIPGDIVTAYLGRHGIVPSRTTDHMEKVIRTFWETPSAQESIRFMFSL